MASVMRTDDETAMIHSGGTMEAGGPETGGFLTQRHKQQVDGKA